MYYNFIRLPGKLILSILLLWLVSISGCFCYVVFYPKRDIYAFPDYIIDKYYNNWEPPIIGPYELVPLNGSNEEVELERRGYYCFNYDDSRQCDVLYFIDMSTGERKTLECLDSNETALILKIDPARKYIMTWTSEKENDVDSARFRIYDINVGKWREIKGPGGVDSFICLGSTGIGSYYMPEASYFSISDRYFVSRTYEGNSSAVKGNYLVFDVKSEDFLTFHGLVNITGY
jgi:hypothetical protein